MPPFSPGLDPSPLLCPHSESGFVNVYRASPTGTTESPPWTAKVKRGGVSVSLGRTYTPLQAALLIAAWYRREYGPDWPLAFAERKATPVAVYGSTRSGKWYGIVYEWGVPQIVQPAPRCYYPTAAAARTAIRKWLADHYGLFAPVAVLSGALYRALSGYKVPMPPIRPAGRLGPRRRKRARRAGDLFAVTPEVPDVPALRIYDADAA